MSEDQRVSRDDSGFVARAFAKLLGASVVIVALLWGVHAINDGATYDVAKIIAALVLVVLTALTFKRVLTRSEGSVSGDDAS